MAAPQTGFEAAGAWTTLDHEAAFLATIDAETPATVATVGTSTGGRPVRTVTLGAGAAQTMLIVCLQHGNEQASREAALAQLRDLAYSTDPSTLAYLQGHRIVWMPTVNPDGFPDTRETDTGGNTNRDHFTLTQPETQAVAATIRTTGPHLIVDAHEYWAGSLNWLGRGNGLPGTHPAIQALGNDLFTASRSVLQGMGKATAQYEFEFPRASLGTVAGAYHAVGLLSETNALTDTMAQRVDIQRVILDEVRTWHEANAAACTTARNASRLATFTQGEPFQMAIGQYLDKGTVKSVNASGYRITGTLPARFDVFGITVGADGVVSTAQPARAFVHYLLDPESDDQQVQAVRLAPVQPPIRAKRTIQGTYVQVNGMRYPVLEIITQQGGERAPAQLS